MQRHVSPHRRSARRTSPGGVNSRRSGGRCRAFTIIELLIVMGIIAALAAISITVIGNILSTAKTAATQTTIQKIDELFQKRLSALRRWFEKHDKYVRGSSNLPRYVQDQFDPAKGFTRAQSIALSRKWHFQQVFPQFTSGGTATHADNAEALYELVATGASGASNAELGSDSADSDLFGSSEVQDTDGDGKMELIDGWGTPLHFYRWPTRLLKPDGTNFLTGPGTAARALIPSLPTTGLDKDPDDPLGSLNGLSPARKQQFVQSFHDLNTYHLPLVVSAGPDRELGLYEPGETSDFGHLCRPIPGSEAWLDNITNRNFQAGGQ